MSFPPLLSCVTIWRVWPQMSVSCGNNAVMSTPAAAVPFVTTFGTNNFTQGQNKGITKHNICSIKLKDAETTTSDFYEAPKNTPGYVR